MKLQIEKLGSDMLLAQKNALRAELNAVKNDVANLRVTYDDALKRLSLLLDKAISMKDDELISEFLDQLFVVKFTSQKYDDMEKLRVNYQAYKFSPVSWANIAIADMFLYEQSYSPIYKQKALEAYGKALEELPSYGDAYAVRLIIHMIDYERQRELEVKEQEKKDALKLIDTINSGSVFSTSYSAYSYFTRNIKDLSLGKYINTLFQIFPYEMNLMSNRFATYMQQFYPDRYAEYIKTEVRTKLPQEEVGS